MRPPCRDRRRCRPDDGDVHGVDDLRDKRHGGGVSHVSAAFAAFGDHSGGAGALNDTGKPHGRDDGNDLDTSLVPGLHVLHGVAGARHDHGHVLFDDNLGDLICKRAHEHDVHAEGLACFGAERLDFGTEPRGVRVHRGYDAKAACFGYCRCEGGVGDPCHAALEDGLFDAQRLADGGAQHLSSP